MCVCVCVYALECILFAFIPYNNHTKVVLTSKYIPNLFLILLFPWFQMLQFHYCSFTSPRQLPLHSTLSFFDILHLYVLLKYLLLILFMYVRACMCGYVLCMHVPSDWGQKRALDPLETGRCEPQEGGAENGVLPSAIAASALHQANCPVPLHRHILKLHIVEAWVIKLWTHCELW